MYKKYENSKSATHNPKKISYKKYSIKLTLKPEINLNYENYTQPFSKAQLRDVSKHKMKYNSSNEIHFSTEITNNKTTNKSPKYKYNDILTNTYACTAKSTKLNDFVSFKGITPKNKKLFPISKEDNRIFKLSSFKDNIFKPIWFKKDENEKEVEDILDENDHALQKIKKEIKTVLTGNNFNKNDDNIDINHFYGKTDNRINFQEDVMIMPHIKNKLHTSSRKYFEEKKMARQNSLQLDTNNFLLSERVIKKSRQESENLLINPNLIDHKSNKYITKLKRIVQKQKDSNNNKNKTDNNYIKEIINNRLKSSDGMYNKEFKEYFTLNIMKYKNIDIVNTRIKNTILSYNEKYDNFKNLKF